MTAITGWGYYPPGSISIHHGLWMPEPISACPRTEMDSEVKLSIAKDAEGKFHLAFAASRMDTSPSEYYFGKFDTLEAAKTAYVIYKATHEQT